MFAKYMRVYAVIGLALILAGCSTASIVSPPDRPRLDAPAAQSMASCKLPSDLPPGEMTQRDIERYWGADRKHLIECLKKHGILRDYIIDRDGAITKRVDGKPSGKKK